MKSRYNISNNKKGNTVKQDYIKNAGCKIAR